MKSASVIRAILLVAVFAIIAVIAVLLPAFRRRTDGGPWVERLQITELAAAFERCRMELGAGKYPPGSTDDPEGVKQFLAKAFPKYDRSTRASMRHRRWSSGLEA